jgi:flagellar hook protein FlgE
VVKFRFRIPSVVCLLLLIVGPLAPDSWGERVPVSSPKKFWRQAPLEVRANDLSLAIVGDGFFSLINPMNGQRIYSRLGDFTLDREGFIAQKSTGFRLELETGSTLGPLRLGSFLRVERAGKILKLRRLSISSHGVLEAHYAENERRALGKIKIALFDRPTELRRVATHLFAPSSRSGAPELRSPRHTARVGGIESRVLEKLSEPHYEATLSSPEIRLR